MIHLKCFAVMTVILLSASFSHATKANDDYVAGYAASVLKLNLNLDMPSLIVKDGVITLPSGSVKPYDQDKAVQLLSDIPGVKAVNISDDTFQESMAASLGDEKAASSTQSFILSTGLLPPGHLFKPLMADPRWAHFSVAYRNDLKNKNDGRNISSLSFGETIPFYRGHLGKSSAQWEGGLQAGVFSDFNLDAPSTELLNSDFIGSFYSSMRAGQFSAIGRIYHQSSHLGDEFLLRKLDIKFERINLSYEGVDLRGSYEFPHGIRVYGGGGGLFRTEPSELKAWSIQYGAEYRSPWRIESCSIRPVAGFDCRNSEENNWNTDVTARAGVEFEKFQVLGRKLQILIEYYKGYSPVGQFYKDKAEYVGLGAHYLF